MSSLNDEWNNFLNNDFDDFDDFDDSDKINEQRTNVNKNNIEVPKSSDIYISTKTKIVYLNNPINLKEVFWNIPIIQYETPKVGIVKKQMKFNSDTVEELNLIETNLKNEENFINTYILTHLDSVNSNKKTYKDIRKISIGISMKDIISSRGKQKSAFYNCFVLIVRLNVNNNFKEFHVKVFNTGKLEIPGIQSDIVLYEILDTVVNILKPFTNDNLEYDKDTFDTVLINSNFNCGYEINREKLYSKLVDKYNINACYDPCSYPGIQCKYIITNGNETTTISYMIFRTGSILIVGKCDEEQLHKVYNYLKDILYSEFHEINQGVIDYESVKLNKNEVNKKKKQKRIIYVSE